MNSNLNEIEIKNSIITELDKIIDNNKKRLEERKERTGNKKKSFLDKINFGHTTEKQIEDVTEIRNELFNLELLEADILSINDDLANSLNAACSCLENNQDINSFVNMVNEPLKNNINEYRKKIALTHQKINNLTAKAKLGTIPIGLYNSFGSFVANIGTLNSNVNDLFNKLNNNKQANLYKYNENGLIKEKYDDIFIKNLEDMIQKGKLDKTIVGNFQEFKNHYINIKRQENYIQKYKECINKLKDYGNTYSNVIKFLSQKEKECIVQIEKSQKYINKYNIQELINKANKADQEYQQEQMVKIGYSQYKNLAYQMEQAKESGNIELQTEISQKMYKCAFNYKLNNSDLFKASMDGKKEYLDDKAKNKAIADGRREREEQGKAVKSEIYNFLREEAIKELKSAGILDNISPVIKNGDISVAEELREQERLITEKIQELGKICEMTPEERGLQFLKENGRVPKDATVDNLTTQQKMDFRYAFRDNAYEFVSKYKQEMQKEQNKTVYAEYIVYKAKLDDKSKAISFTEFIASKYQYESKEQEEMVGRSR